jgi:hypothetical protein
MAFGPGYLGFAYFAGVKCAGYCGYATLLNQSKAITRSGCRIPPAWKSGLVRTGIGIVVGIVVGLGYWKVFPNNQFMDKYGSALFFGGLVPVRVLEWYCFLWLLYKKCNLDRMSQAKFIFYGIVVSFLLDAVGYAAALVLPGGAWIC